MQRSDTLVYLSDSVVNTTTGALSSVPVDTICRDAEAICYSITEDLDSTEQNALHLPIYV